MLCSEQSVTIDHFCFRMTFALALVVVCWAVGARAGEPVFDPSTLMRLVLVPADVPVGSVIYRVRASDPDFDYPLHFELIGKGCYGLYLIDMTIQEEDNCWEKHLDPNQIIHHLRLKGSMQR